MTFIAPPNWRRHFEQLLPFGASAVDPRKGTTETGVVCGSLVSRVDDGDEEYGAHGDEDHDEDYDGEDKGESLS